MYFSLGKSKKLCKMELCPAGSDLPARHWLSLQAIAGGQSELCVWRVALK
ncbi:MAG: hypothetical protein ABIJ91_02870 [Candidatus Kuenenbacteria bacterium]